MSLKLWIRKSDRQHQRNSSCWILSVDTCRNTKVRFSTWVSTCHYNCKKTKLQRQHWTFYMKLWCRARGNRPLCMYHSSLIKFIYAVTQWKWSTINSYSRRNIWSIPYSLAAQSVSTFRPEAKWCQQRIFMHRWNVIFCPIWKKKNTCHIDVLAGWGWVMSTRKFIIDTHFHFY